MKYRILIDVDGLRFVVVHHSPAGDMSTFSADMSNPVYESFLQSQSLTDAEVQAMEPDVLLDMA